MNAHAHVLGTSGHQNETHEVSGGSFPLKKSVLGEVAMGRMELERRSKGEDVHCEMESWE